VLFSLTIHGDADMTVPYQEAVSLHEALTKAGTPNQLLTISGRQARRLHAFLAKNGLAPK
jgi:fermentation-respiration switch protein FrsA (DUF1100 family)